jgi:hypothetical protein
MPVKPLWPYAWELFARAKTLEPYAYLAIAALASAIATWVVLRARHRETAVLPLHIGAMNPQER